jgi:uncharacterized membrane protein YphA (DoxX/SURF4 family)
MECYNNFVKFLLSESRNMELEPFLERYVWQRLSRGLFAVRFLIGTVFLVYSYFHFPAHLLILETHFPASIGYVLSSLPLIGSILIILGLFTEIGLALLIIFTLVGGLFLEGPYIPLFAGLILLLITGPGKYSLRNRRKMQWVSKIL